MKPIFFPFTSITQYDAEAVLSCFDSFCYFSTYSDDELILSESEWFKTLWKEKALITPITLSKEETARLNASVKSWQTWADSNYGKHAGTGYLQSIFQDKPYFKSDSDIASIKTQIERGETPANSFLKTNSLSKNLNSHQDVLNNALLFLRLAAISDIENENIDKKLASVELFENQLFAEIRGVDADNNNEEKYEERIDQNNLKPLKSDRGGVMTEQRFRAWVNLFTAKQAGIGKQSGIQKQAAINGDSVNFSSNIFVTTSKAVADYIIYINEKGKLMLDIDNFKVHKEKKSSYNYELFQIAGKDLTVILAELQVNI